jgi:hypothetical protein
LSVDLTSKELSEVINVGHDLLDLKTVDEVAGRALDLLSPIFRVEKSNFFITHGQTGEPK